MNQFDWGERGIRSSPFGLVEEAPPGEFIFLVAVEVKTAGDRTAVLPLGRKKKEGRDDANEAQHNEEN